MKSKWKNIMLRNRNIAVGEMKTKLLNKIGACEHCGYNTFKEILELAHIIHGHEPEKVVRNNVFLLCPTCHRAFDRGFIEIKGEFSDCHLVNYQSPFVLAGATTKIKRLKNKKSLKWFDAGNGKFYTKSITK